MTTHPGSLLRIPTLVFTIFITGALLAETQDPAAMLDSTESSVDLVNQAYELFETGQTDLALEGFNKALDLDADSTIARLGQAMVFQEQQRHMDAFKAYDLVVKKEPSHAFAWNGRGLAAFNLENFDEALSSFKHAVQDQPVNGYFYESMAWTYLCRGEYTEAATSAKQATLMYNQNGESTLYPLLIAYFAQLEAGQSADAQRTLAYAQNNKSPNQIWPSPIIDYLSGAISASDLISFVTDHAQETEAQTYIGLHLRSLGEQENAQPHLDWVAKHGDERVFEFTLARSLRTPNKVALLSQ